MRAALLSKLTCCLETDFGNSQILGQRYRDIHTLWTNENTCYLKNRYMIQQHTKNPSKQLLWKDKADI